LPPNELISNKTQLFFSAGDNTGVRGVYDGEVVLTSYQQTQSIFTTPYIQWSDSRRQFDRVPCEENRI